ncbi:hypothetical protein V500_08235 [Pseudogymnoascus sp. VKM F-4518 (FW-2643)]|nr:hypothetical protein V500_08235 [Pseudogymnoascus sp. VKM F-4518 (FW-2643)]
MFAPSSIQQVPPGGDVEMNQESTSATSLPVAAVPAAETNAAINKPVSRTPLPTSEEAPAPAGAMDSGTQPSTGYSTIFVDHNEPEDSDDDVFPVLGRKRKRNSTNVDYLADVADRAEPNEQSEKKTGWTWKGTQGPTWKGHEVKHGVPIGVWSLSDEPDDEKKHVLYGFLDPKFALHGRKYPERKDGSKYQGNFPSGTGTWAAKSAEWLLDPHLKDLTRKELTEYVRIRMRTWKCDESPQDRDAFDKSAAAEAKAVAAASASESTIKSELKGNSARKAKNSTPRKSNEAKLGKSTPRESFGEPSSSNNNSTKKVPEQEYTPSVKREERALATSNGSPFGTRASREPKMASPLPRSTPNAKPSNNSSPRHSETPPGERSKYVIKGKDVLIGYWKDSSEPEVMNKHAMYGVIQAHGVFRVKVVPETRYGRYLEEGNYPKQSGGCWVNYDTCVLEKYLKDLIRTEIEEYCRICVADPDYNNRTQGPAIDRAVQEAKRRVAEKAAAKGLDIIEYNRKRCDQLDKGAIAREVEKQKRNGEVVAPVKAEVKHTAKRSDKATSDARAQMVRLARKEAKEARERETMNSKGDADMEEAMRRSASEQEALKAQKKLNKNSDAPPATPAGDNNSNGGEASWSRHAKDLTSAYKHLRPGNSTPASDAGSVNGGESENVKFYLLDRETQRVKMERWCKLKPTSQYHTMDREGQKRHVEKHIDQLIARQTGAAMSRRPKKRSRTGDYPSAGPSQPGMVSAPSPLAGMTRATSTPATTMSASQEPVASQADTAFATADALRSRNGPIILAPATPAAPEVAAVQSSSRFASPAARQEVPSERSTRNIRTNLTLRSVLNEPITPILSEKEVTPQPKPVENTADVPMVDAPVENTTMPAQPASSKSTPPVEPRATPVATVETEAVQDEPRAVSTQPTPVENTINEQRSTSKPYEPPSVAATLEEAANPSRYEASPDVPMTDAPTSTTPALSLPPGLSTSSSSMAPEAIETHPADTPLSADQPLKPQFAPHLQQQQLFSTPQTPRLPTDHPQPFMSAPRPYVTPYPTPPTIAPSSAPPTRAPAPPAAPAIFVGQDGVKYSVDPSSEFGDLLTACACGEEGAEAAEGEGGRGEVGGGGF